MFTQLANLLENNSLTLTLSRQSDNRITVAVVPISQNDKDKKSQIHPLVVTGTAEELDANFAQSLQNYVAEIGTYKDNLASIRQQLKQAEDELRAEEREKRKKLTPKKEAAKVPAPAEDATQTTPPQPVQSSLLPEVQEGLGKPDQD